MIDGNKGKIFFDLPTRDPCDSQREHKVLDLVRLSQPLQTSVQNYQLLSQPLHKNEEDLFRDLALRALVRHHHEVHASITGLTELQKQCCHRPRRQLQHPCRRSWSQSLGLDDAGWI